MLKYYNAMVVFEEIPTEITLCINITNCQCHCKGCHSKFLWEDVGTELTNEEIDKLINANKGVTCVCFMGGDINPHRVDEMALYVKEIHNLRVGWYSGMDEMSKDIDLSHFNYIKIGHYDEERGPLNKKTTNQVFYRVNDDKTLTDETHLFWKRGIESKKKAEN